AWLARALAEMMSADLAAGEKLRLVPGADAMRLAGTLPREPGALPLDALARARSQLAADFVVKGSYVTLPSPQGEILRLDVLLQSTASGDTIVTASTTGASHRLFALVDSAATQLRSKLGLETPPVAAAVAAAAALPAQPEATRLYAEGLEKLRRYDALGARPLLERVIVLEPRFPLAHLALSQAVAALGYDRVAVDEAKRALALAGRLTREQQLAIAAALAEAQKDWNAATTTNRSLFQFFPDNLEYGLSLARTLVAGGRAAEAQGVVAAMQRRPPPAGEDPRLDLAAAAASEALSDWQRQLASARIAARKARAEQRTWLLGKALLSEAGAAGDLGQAQVARDQQREAARIFHDLGDASAEADALVGIANDIGSRGDVEGALAGYRRALATFERCGNRKGAEHVWSDIANFTWLRGNVEEALRAGRRELALSREIDDRRGIVWGLGALGNVLADQGAIDEALRMQTEGLAISREIGDRSYTSFCLGAIADTHFAAGDLEQAWRGYGEALDLNRRLQDVVGIARLEDDLGTVLLAEDRLDEAARQFQAALAARERMDDRDEAAETRINLAQVRNEQGRPAEGLALARRSLQDFVAMHQSGNTALALAIGALAEIQLHRTAPALADCGRAREALRGNRQNQANLFVLLAKARAEAAAGRPAAARAAAAAALAVASGTHALASALEARLVLGELDLRERPAAGAQALRALAQEARVKRFLLIARRADGLLAGR
ncbi:MAG TPA: tetratricopeptide repeat protein, partial [Thermoanaerobaculia bacterium]|nr:tetratricopeptide repeat protein [Thermoanaerobaculia bacterium]